MDARPTLDLCMYRARVRRAGKQERRKLRRLGRRPCGGGAELAAAVDIAVREANAQPRLQPEALLELKQSLHDEDWRQRAAADIDQYLKERSNLQRVQSMLEREETLGMDAEDVEDFRQHEDRLLAQCRSLEAERESLKQLRVAAGKAAPFQLASGRDGGRQLLALLPPTGEVLRELCVSCDSTSLEQLQDRALVLLSALQRETASRIAAHVEA